MTPLRASFAFALFALALACAAPRQPWRDTTPPQVLLDVLPRQAIINVDGAPVGSGAREVAVPDPAHRYRFTFSAPGFVPADREEQGAKLSGARLGVVLRPEGFGSARRLDLDDGAGLAGAAALLQRRGAHLAALEYADRAVEVAPVAPLPHRVAGDAALALGRRARAIQAYSTYLALAPEAPDHAAVSAHVEALRGDLTVPPPPDAR